MCIYIYIYIVCLYMYMYTLYIHIFMRVFVHVVPWIALGMTSEFFSAEWFAPGASRRGLRIGLWVGLSSLVTRSCLKAFMPATPTFECIGVCTFVSDVVPGVDPVWLTSRNPVTDPPPLASRS